VLRYHRGLCLVEPVQSAWLGSPIVVLGNERIEIIIKLGRVQWVEYSKLFFANMLDLVNFVYDILNLLYQIKFSF
jgi:hypothetical protein